MSSTNKPAVIGGVGTVPLGGASVEWTATRWGTKPTVRPARTTDQFTSEQSFARAHHLLDDVRDGRAGLGGLGPHGTALEQRVAHDIGPNAEGQMPIVLIVGSGTAGLRYANMAVATQRYLVEGHQPPTVPNAPTSSRSFKATWYALMDAGLQPRPADVSLDTGCVSAEALQLLMDDATVLLNPVALYDHSPNIEEISDLSLAWGTPVVFDAAHGPFITWNGRHILTYQGIKVIAGSGGGTKATTSGSDAGFVATYDRMVAAIVAKMRNDGDTPNPLPEWWPEGVPNVAGDNGRKGEIPAILWGGSMDVYNAHKDPCAEATRDIHRGLDFGPWRLLSEQPELGGLNHRLQLIFDPARSDNARAWERVGYAAAGRALAHELLTEVSRSYPPPSNPASEFAPGSRPWMWRGVVPQIRQVDYPNTSWLAARVHVLNLRALTGGDASGQLLEAIKLLDRWVEDSRFQTWARDYTSSLGSN